MAVRPGSDIDCFAKGARRGGKREAPTGLRSRAGCFINAQSRWVFMGRSRKFTRKGPNMLYTIAVILLILWLLGMVGSYTLGGLIHILLVVALVM